MFQFISKKAHKKKKKNKQNDEKTEAQTDGERERKGDESSPSKKKKKKKKKNKNNENGPESGKKNDLNSTNSSGKSQETENGDKKKKKKNKKNNDEKAQESGKKNDLDSTKTKKAPNFDIEKLKAALGKAEESSGGGFSHEKTLKHDEAKNRLKSSQFRFLNEKLYSQNGVQSLKMFNTDKVS